MDWRPPLMDLRNFGRGPHLGPRNGKLFVLFRQATDPPATHLAAKVCSLWQASTQFVNTLNQ